MRYLMATLLFVSTTTVSGSTFAMGAMPDHGETSFSTGTSNNNLTVIDFSHPATAAGAVTSVALRWSSSSCLNAFKIKFLRPASTFGNYTVIADMGPYPVAGAVPLVIVLPQVAVQPGDLLAITQLQPASCGGVMLTYDDPASITMRISSDIQSGSFTGITLLHGLTVNAKAFVTLDAPAGILAAVGATPGAGAFFRTAVQLANPTSTTMTGKLVYHPQGQSAASSDPSINYSVGPHATWSQNDIVTTMGLSGLGSMDLLTFSGSIPRAVVRVFNDRTVDGTDGFVEPMLRPEDAMSAPSSDIIVVPSDLTNFRVNVGVRTLDDGATLGIYYTSPNDSTVSAGSKTYPANSFIQKPLSEFTGSYKANGHVGIQVTAGSAIIYVSIIDSKTGDSSVYFLGRR